MNPLVRKVHSSYYSPPGQPEGRCLGVSLIVWCPACAKPHQFTTRCPEHGGPVDDKKPVWEWDGKLDPPSFSPSMLVFESGNQPRCHSFLRNGTWEFLSDCTHALAGTSMPMVSLPEWLMRSSKED